MRQSDEAHFLNRIVRNKSGHGSDLAIDTHDLMITSEKTSQDMEKNTIE